MSNHLRHCPKHRRPLPCPHCALSSKPAETTVAMLEPETAPVAAEPAPLGTPVPPETETLLDSIEKGKAAKYQRERRKLKAEQLAAIKKALQTPIAEIKIAAEEQTRLDKLARAQTGLRRGLFLTDAPTGKGELVTGGYDSEQMGLVAAARDRAAVLGSPTGDSDSDEEYWPENDRCRVKPEGTGQNPGDREDDAADDDPDSSEDAKDNKDERGKDADILPGEKFFVKLNDFDNDGLLAELVSFYFVKFYEFRSDDYFFCVWCGAKGESDSTELVCRRCGATHAGDPKIFICRLCGIVCYGDKAAKKHIEDSHGDDRESGHDPRFGNVIYRYLKGGRKMPNIQKAIKKAKADVTT